MRLVVPAEADREIGEVGFGIALDLQCRLLEPVAAQHPFHRYADIAPEHPLSGAGTPRRQPHHLLDPMQTIVVADPLDKCAQRCVRRVRLTRAGRDRVVQARCG